MIKNRFGFWAVWGLLSLVVLLTPIPNQNWTPSERVFTLQASQFAYSPSILKVNPGDRVTIELVASDVVHGLAIDGYDVQAIADPGQTARVQFTADRPGTFRFRCTVTCGDMHPFMTGKLAVGSNLLLWRAAGLAFLAAAAILGLFRS